MTQPSPNLSGTMRYVYGNNEEEFVFCHKGRPFAVLTSPHFPTPAATFIDHHLVKELGIKMNDIQCKKISFCGQKLRLLGKISCSMQCVKDGAILGNFHLKASVIENLNHHFDTHCIAGAKMTALLHGDTDCVESINCTSSGAPSPARSETSTGSGLSVPSSCSTPTRDLLQRIAGGHQSPSEESPPRPASPPSLRRSPPGFPPSPQPKPLLSPLSSNKMKLGQMYHDADLAPHDHAELTALHHADPDGQVTYDDNGITNFFTSDGTNYSLGHGRDKCSYSKCYGGKNIPTNCGFNDYWTFPDNFQFCGQDCRGAFCSCLRQFR